MRSKYQGHPDPQVAAAANKRAREMQGEYGGLTDWTESQWASSILDQRLPADPAAAIRRIRKFGADGLTFSCPCGATIVLDDDKAPTCPSCSRPLRGDPLLDR
jgi:hypothetical protein